MLYLIDRSFEQPLDGHPKLTLTFHCDSEGQDKVFTEMLYGDAVWDSDKLLALAQLMFEAEHAPKTISVKDAFQKYGAMLSPGDTLLLKNYGSSLLAVTGEPMIANTEISHETYLVVK